MREERSSAERCARSVVKSILVPAIVWSAGRMVAR